MRIAIASFIIALLSGMGVGSGGLLVIYLTLIEGIPQLTAQGINLLFFLFAAASSLLLHVTQRRIYIGAVLILSLGGIIGSLAGSYLAANLPAALLGKIFGVTLVISGVLSLRKRPKKAAKEQKAPSKPSDGPFKL